MLLLTTEFNMIVPVYVGRESDPVLSQKVLLR